MSETESVIIKKLSVFKQDKNTKGLLFGSNHRYDLGEILDYNKYRLLRYLFVKFLGFWIVDQPMEKVNWEIPMTYKEIPISFAHQKFGFRLYIDKDLAEEKANLLFKEIDSVISYCLNKIEPIIRAEGLISLNKGEVIVENKYFEIEREFNFFLKESLRKKKMANIPKSLKLSTRTEVMKYDFELDMESRYLEDAAYVSFFSLIEHICILGLAFIDSKEKYDFFNFSKKTWQDKFKEVFPISDPKFSIFYNKLVNLSKYRRNPVAHGHLDKLYTIFYFYVPEARSRIPMGLYDQEVFLKLKDDGNLKVLSDFLSFIRKNPKTKKWMQYISRGLDISYNRSSLLEYEGYLNSSSKVGLAHLDYMTRMVDDMANMDW